MHVLKYWIDTKITNNLCLLDLQVFGNKILHIFYSHFNILIQRERDESKLNEKCAALLKNIVHIV